MAGGPGGDEDLWGERARDWADVQEPLFVPLYEAVLDATAVGSGVRLLDAGCGSGLALAMAAQRGATVAGFDTSEGLLAIATERLPDADLRVGSIEDPPHAGGFDVITMVNVAHHAPDATRFLELLRSQGRPGALFAVTTWGPPERCEMRELFAGIGVWRQDDPHSGPFGLSAPGGVEAFLEGSGFELVHAADVACPFLYPGLDWSLRGVLAAAPFVAAGRRQGRDAVRRSVAGKLGQFRQADGTIRVDNVFRCVVAREAR